MIAVRGNPSEEELAAVVAVLAIAQTPTAPAAAQSSEWSAPTRRHRRSAMVPSLPRGWVISTRPF